MCSSLKVVNQLQINQFFPLEVPREKQLRALDFIESSVAAGYHDIVIGAPTGIGKTGIGVSACFWGSHLNLPGTAGGYYLVTQKMLQDQLENDLPNYREGLRSGASLKSASEYACPTYRACSVGLAVKKKRPCSMGDSCVYRLARNAFLSAPLAVTNYPYFLTERTHVGKMPMRRVLVADECHTLERQLIRFVDLVVSESTLPEWAPSIAEIPDLPDIHDYVRWIKSTYLPVVSQRAESMLELASDAARGSEKLIKDAFKLDQHVSKVAKAAELIETNPRDWIYWVSEDADGKKEYIARPLNAAPFAPLVTGMGTVRIYMSAFPGNKRIFCRSLGLDQSKVAWCSLKSTFPVQNRPIVIGSVGSMSRRNLESSLPQFLKTLDKIFARHHSEKGLIHCNSYALGKVIFEHFRNTDHGQRLIFPQKADDRDTAFEQHCTSEFPTVLLTPSMTEGFDFTGNLARWQVIAKVPYPSLGDRQIVAKKDQDQDWYHLETIKTIIQAAGRIVRSDTDVGYTYILDSDFDRLYEQCQDYFPRWFTDAFVYPRRSS
jgi:Rad3-related DNA helicase